MGALPNSQPFAFRFAPYIMELREFLGSSRLHFGAPDDIFPVTERLQNSKDFAEDMSSMIRSILLREGGSMAHAQLLEILAIAIGGPEMDQAPQAYRQPLRQLLSFLTGVLRRPWNLPPGEEAEPLAPARVAAQSPASDTLDDRGIDRPEVDSPELVKFPSGPSGPFAAAAALSAAEPKQFAAEPKQFAAETPATTGAESTPVTQPSDFLLAEPEYPETEFTEYEALDPASSEPPLDAAAPQPAEAAQTAPETATQEASLAESQPALEAFPQESSTLAEIEAVDREMRQADPVEVETTAPHAALEAASHPEPEAAAAATEPESIFEPAPITLEPVAASPMATVFAPAPVPVPAAVVPIVPSAKWPRRHSPSLSSWNDSPFDDSFSELEGLPSEPAVYARPAAAPWISAADGTPENPPWISPSTRNVLLAGAAAIAVAILVAVALRPTPEPSEPVSAAVSPAANSPATSLTPQPSPAPAAALPATPTASNDPFTPQQNPTRPPRTRSGEDEEDTGSYVAKPTYRSFVTQPASSGAAANSVASPQSSPANATHESSDGSTQESAPVERRSPEASLVAEPVRQSFRNTDASLVRDSRPTRPLTPSRALNGSPTFRVSSGVMAANLISAPNPDYPTFARLTHTQGEVLIQAVISRDGRVSATHVLSGHRLLRGAAVDAVKRWRYRPYVADGHPVDVATIIRVDFRAHN